MRNFENLEVWCLAHELALEVYRITAVFPPSERYSLTSQLRRSAASVPSNIAEGCGRDTDHDFARFVAIATGSASETLYQLILARDLGYLDEPEFGRLRDLTTRTRAMLTKLGQTLRRSDAKPPR